MGWLSLQEEGGRRGASVWLNEKVSCVTAIGFWCFLWVTCLSRLSVCLSVCRAAGMNMSPVSRLKKTWSKVKTAKFDILEVSLKPPHHS